MNITVDFTSFKSWQRTTRKLLQQARAEETALLDAEYREVIDAQAEKQATIQRIVKEFEAYCASRPGDRAGIADEETMAKYCAASAELERIANQFDLKWRRQYEHYVLDMAALDKEHQRVMALTRHPNEYEAARKRHENAL